MLADSNVVLTTKGKDNMTKVAEFLKNYRRKHNLTQKELCKYLDIDRGNYARVELGVYDLPLKLIKRLYRSLNHEEKLELQIAIKEDLTRQFIDNLSKVLDDLNKD